jgi:hypothetical protein
VTSPRAGATARYRAIFAVSVGAELVPTTSAGARSAWQRRLRRQVGSKGLCRVSHGHADHLKAGVRARTPSSEASAHRTDIADWRTCLPSEHNSLVANRSRFLGYLSSTLPAVTTFSAAAVFEQPIAFAAVVASILTLTRSVYLGPLAKSALALATMSPWFPYILLGISFGALWFLFVWEAVNAWLESISIWGVVWFLCQLLLAVVTVITAFITVEVARLTVVRPIFWLIGREIRSRQVYRDRVASKIMNDLLAIEAGAHVTQPRFCLYLRPFATTNELPTTSTGNPGPLRQPGNIRVDAEVLLSAAFPLHCPLIALGEPGRLLSTKFAHLLTWPIDGIWDLAGTGKVQSAEGDWRAKVQLLAHAAEAIVIVPFDFPGTRWELEWLNRNGNLGKCVIAMPPSVPDGPDYRPSWEDAERLLHPMGVAVPQYGESGSLLLIDDKNRIARSYSSYLSTVIVGPGLLHVQCWRLRKRILCSKQRAVGA